MGSALLDNSSEASRITAPPSVALRGAESLPEPSVTDLRRHAAERLAAHRSRRAGDTPSLADAAGSLAPRNKRVARIASAVAERYARTQSYREFLAAEAQRAVEKANAAAEVAARNAQALAAAHQELLQDAEGAFAAGTDDVAPDGAGAWARELASSEAASGISVQEPATASLWPELEPGVEQPAENPRRFHPPAPRAKKARQPNSTPQAGEAAPEKLSAPDLPSASAGLLAAGITIRLYQDDSGATRVALDPPVPAPVHSSGFASSGFAPPPNEPAGGDLDEEARLLDEEIAFRQQPEFEEPAGPPEPLPANLIEFPRQLVAARKARPRLAEGPLREDGIEVPGAGQLRIFEVEPEQIATAAPGDISAEAEASAQWTTIWLDPQPQAGQLPRGSGSEELARTSSAAARRSMGSLPNVASVGRRVLAASVNAAILAGAFLCFGATSLWLAGHLPGPGARPHSIGAEAAAVLSRDGVTAALPFTVGAFALLAAIYQALFFSLSTATPGMRAARIALCTFSDENPSRPAVRRRLLALLLSALPMGLGFLWATLDEERLCWHDRICGTYQRTY